MRKGKRKKDYLQWWMDRIAILTGFKEEARKLYSLTNTTYTVGSWALLKLVILEYYVDVYTTIIKKIFNEAYYLDLFAGPGLDLIKETGDVIFGSPLIADKVPKPEKKFDKLILIEQDRSSAAALQTLLPHATVIPEDVNVSGLEKALGLFPKDRSVPCLAFVDPEGLDLQWSTLQMLLQRWSDVVINYQPSAVRRAAGSIYISSSYATTLTKFFGTEKWALCNTEEEYLELYRSQIEQHKDYTIPIKVQGPGGFHYYIIVAVRKTGGAQRWIDAIHRAKEHIEKANYKDAERFLRIFKGEQRTLF